MTSDFSTERLRVPGSVGRMHRRRRVPRTVQATGGSPVGYAAQLLGVASYALEASLAPPRHATHHQYTQSWPMRPPGAKGFEMPQSTVVVRYPVF